MYNLAQGIEDRGIAKGEIKGVIKEQNRLKQLIICLTNDGKMQVLSCFFLAYS